MNLFKLFSEILHCMYHDIILDLRYGYAVVLVLLILSLTLFASIGKLTMHKIELTLLVLYLGVLVTITLLNRTPGSRDGLSLRLFETLNPSHPQSYAYLIENVLLFVPFGLLIPACFPKMNRLLVCMTAGMAVSILIESIQYITKSGFCQLDDVVANTAGTILGFLIYSIFYALHRKCRKNTIIPSEKVQK